MSDWQLTGRLVTGLGQGSGFTGLDWVREAFRAELGIELHPGTLNLVLDAAADLAEWERIKAGSGVVIPGQEGACDARCFPVQLAASCTAAIVLPDVPGYPNNQLELVAALPLRQHLQLDEGDPVQVASAVGAPLEAVIFDVDGTLVNSVDAYHIAAGRAAAPFGYEVTRDAVRQALNGQYKFWELIFPDPEELTDELIATLRRETMRHWEDVLDEHVTLLPGVADALAQLKSAGMRLAIFTGSRGESLAPLEAAGLLDMFEFVLTGADVANAKPDPEGVLQCLEVLEVPPAAAAYVGDSVPDMGAGLSAGTRAVGLLTGAADSAELSAAGAHRLAADHTTLVNILLARS